MTCTTTHLQLAQEAQQHHLEEEVEVEASAAPLRHVCNGSFPSSELRGEEVGTGHQQSLWSKNHMGSQYSSTQSVYALSDSDTTPIATSRQETFEEPYLTLSPSVGGPVSGGAKQVAAQLAVAIDEYVDAHVIYRYHALQREFSRGPLYDEDISRSITNRTQWMRNEEDRAIRSMSPRMCSLFAVTAPALPFRSYVERLLAYCRCNPATFAIAACYLHRLAKISLVICPRSVHRVFLGCFSLAVKYFEDKFFPLGFYAQCGGVIPSDLKDMELCVFELLGYDCGLNTQEAAMVAQFQRAADDFAAAATAGSR